MTLDVNGRDAIVPTKTDRSVRDLPLPPRELALLKAMRAYSREFAAQRSAAGLKAITLGKLLHSNISRMRVVGVAADVVAAWHGHTERMTQAVYGRR